MTPSSPTSLEELATIIASAIRKRGFHVAGPESLALLWNSEPLTPTEKLVRLHMFSSKYGWHATSRQECQSALFQSEQQGPVSAASWRLDGDIERALGRRSAGTRGE